MQKCKDLQDVVRRGFLPVRGYDYLTNLFHIMDLFRKYGPIAERY